MGFDLKTLFKICDKKLDLYTDINIGLDRFNEKYKGFTW